MYAFCAPAHTDSVGILVTDDPAAIVTLVSADAGVDAIDADKPASTVTITTRATPRALISPTL